MDNFSQDSLRFWGMLVPLPPSQLTMQETEMHDKEAEESKEKIRYYRHRRGQLYSSFRDQFMIKYKILDAVISVQCFKFLDLHMNY